MIKMRTTTRLNYRSECSFKAGTIVGVLDEGTTVPVAENFSVMACEKRWRKIKVGRKYYYAVSDYLETV